MWISPSAACLGVYGSPYNFSGVSSVYTRDAEGPEERGQEIQLLMQRQSWRSFYRTLVYFPEEIKYQDFQNISIWVKGILFIVGLGNSTYDLNYPYTKARKML
jgi:hypothetical protein